MALPTIVFDNVNGLSSGTSGAGPGDGTTSGSALSGSSASYTGLVFTLDGSPDLSNVAVDGSHCIWVDTSIGRRVFSINAKDDGADTVTVNETIAGTATGLAWGIGGKRTSLTGDQAYLFAAGSDGLLPGWTVDVLETGTDYESTAELGADCHGSEAGGRINLISSSANRPQIINANNAAGGGSIHALEITGNYWYFENLKFVRNRSGGVSNFAVNIPQEVDLGHHFHKCAFGSHGDPGAGVTGETGSATTFTECLFDAEGSSDFIGILGGGGSTRTGSMTVIGCYFKDCSIAVQLGRNKANNIIGNIFNDCTEGVRLDFSAGAEGTIVLNNTFYLGDYHVLCSHANQELGLIIAGNIMHSPVEYGMSLQANLATIFDNIIYNAGTGVTDADTTLMMSYRNNLTTDPGLTDPANEDFSLDGSGSANAHGIPSAFSSALSSLVGYRDAGAVQREAGGGGGLRLAGRGGLAR